MVSLLSYTFPELTGRHEPRAVIVLRAAWESGPSPSIIVPMAHMPPVILDLTSAKCEVGFDCHTAVTVEAAWRSKEVIYFALRLQS